MSHHVCREFGKSGPTHDHRSLEVAAFETEHPRGFFDPIVGRHQESVISGSHHGVTVGNDGPAVPDQSGDDPTPLSSAHSQLAERPVGDRSVGSHDASHHHQLPVGELDQLRRPTEPDNVDELFGSGR